jgi:oligopeptide transport system substrate-binding protein
MTVSKRLLALLLAMAMVVSMAACGSGSSDTATTDTASTDAAATDTASDSESTYTYSYTSGCPNTWSPTDEEGETELAVLGYTTTPLWMFVMNDAKDGYDIIPAGASAMPVDITAEFADKERYGIPDDATEGYVWSVELNPDLCWEDGTPITADDYLYSLQQYLNPDMSNYRASYLYAGSAAFANAEAYYYSNQAGEIVYTSCLDDLGYSSVEEAMADGYTEFAVDLTDFWGLDAGIVSINDETEYRVESVAEGDFEDYVSAKYVYDNYLAPGCDYADSYGPWEIYVGTEVEAGTFEDVGLIKNDDYSLTFVMRYESSEFNFIYNMTGWFLVKEDLYEANKQQTGDIIKSSYGTSVDKYMSYGPYKLVTFQEDKEMTMTKNENWYGFTDEAFEGKYQVTDIDIQYITEYSTVMSLFLQGKLSYVGLSSDDLSTYGSSDYAYYTPSSYSWWYYFTTDLDSLKAEEQPGENRSILAYQEFREAISWALDRTEFVSSVMPASEPGFGLLTPVYMCDPDTGETYRNNTYAQQAMCNVYNASSESEITGYDKAKATELFQAAYDKCLADGNISETDVVTLDCHMYGSDNMYVKMVNFLEDAITEATVGTDLEGKVSINLVEDPDYWSNMDKGLVDITLTAWGGSEMDPYAMMECYCSDTLLKGVGFDPYTATATITVNGVEMTKTLNEWYVALCQGEYINADTDTKNQVLAGMEEALLEYYFVIPVYYATSVGLYEQRLVLGSEEYVNCMIGYGSVMDMTFTMDDAEWAAYCAENNNQLSY